MAQINPDIPIIGNPVSTEDPKTKNALEVLVAAVNSLDNANIASNANINASKLLDGSIATAKLADSGVTTAKIADSNVTTAKLNNEAVTTAKIGDSQVTTAKIGDSQVTTAKIGDSQVTTAKIGNSQVTNAKIVDSAITENKVANGAITADKVAGPLGSFVTPETGVTAEPERPAFCRKYNQGLALLQGQLYKNSGKWTAPTFLGTLAAGFRPAFNTQFVVTGFDDSGSGVSGVIFITVQANGQILISGSSASLTSGINRIDLDGATFHAA